MRQVRCPMEIESCLCFYMYNPRHSQVSFHSHDRGWKTSFCSVFHSSKVSGGRKVLLSTSILPSPRHFCHPRTFLTLLYTNAVAETPENEPAR